MPSSGNMRACSHVRVCVCVRGFARKCFWCDVPVGNNNSSCPGHTYTIAIVTSYIPIMSCQSLPASCHHFLPSLLCHHVISICHIWACIATCHIAIQNLPRHNCHLCVEPNCVYIVKTHLRITLLPQEPAECHMCAEDRITTTSNCPKAFRARRTVGHIVSETKVKRAKKSQFAVAPSKRQRCDKTELLSTHFIHG